MTNLPRADGSSYDVFLSFRGEDTRHSFTDHLYTALEHAGIKTFRDSNDAERGEELKQEIEGAIKASDASIIVLSENYATSSWCLKELALILDRRRDHNHFVLPLFYKVDPSDVRKQKGRFFIQADSSSRIWTEDNVIRWKAALTEVADLIGERVIGSEADFLKKTVNGIYNRLHRKKIYLPPNLIGMDAREKEIGSWINQSEIKFLVIYGMVGSGKSTLAQYIVHSNIQSFKTVSIVQNIGQKCKGPHDMVKLQEQLCTDMVRGKDTRIPTVCQGTPTIEVLLERKKALIVLDDIVKESQMEDLLGSGIINKESKIIVTTDNDLSNWFKLKSRRYEEYKMKLLNDEESLELLSLNAFHSKTPMDGFKELAKRVVEYCEGSPLALKLLGSYLSEHCSISSWESALKLIGKDFHEEIYDALKRSFDLLPYESDKELFLHIACFFVGKDMDYIVKILEPKYSAESEIKTLIRRCFLYVTPDKKLMMHRLFQDMGRSLVDRGSVGLAEHSRIRHVGLTKRSRIWRNKDSYDMLSRGTSSNLLKGLTLDMRLLMKEDEFNSMQIKESPLTTNSLQRMDQLELLQLNYVKLTGSYKDSSHRLLWLCWFGYNKSIIDSDILMGNMVALDLTYSRLKEFEPPTVLRSLKILNFKDSRSLLEIRNIYLIPNLETLILWNCHCLLRVCKTIGNLEKLALLNMTGCKNMYNSGESTQEFSFPLPLSLERLFLNNCKLKCTYYFPLSFCDQTSLQYLNLGNSLFEELPCYIHLKNLLVLDLSFCSRLKSLLCLPSTLSELYVYYCNSIEKITFDSGRFTLQEFGYEGCIILSEIEGFLKLVLVSKLDETDLGHMMWLKEYENHDVCLVGDDGLTKYRSRRLQMLYEFNIMSISLPDIKHPNLTPEYASQYTCLSFDVPSCPGSRSLKGLNVTFRYRISGENWAWFCKISKTGDSDLIYSPKVFGKPASGKVGIWLSYWPIGNSLDVGDEVKVSILVMRGLEVLECGARLVYTDDDVTGEMLENKIGWVKSFGGDLSGFQLITGAYYLCRHDFFEQMEVGRLASDWFSILVGDHIDSTEVRGWRMTGRPRQLYQSFTELKTVRCIMYEPATTEGIYRIAESTKSSIVDRTIESTSELSEAIPMDMVINDTMESTSSSLFDIIESSDSDSNWGWLSPQDDMDVDDVDINNKIGYDMDVDDVDINNKIGYSDSEYDDFGWFKETMGSPRSTFDLKSDTTDTESDYKSEFTDIESDLSSLSLLETMNPYISSGLNLSASNMFNSNVELSNFLGSIDILPDAYHAILETTSSFKLHRNSSGIPILAFDISPDYTKRFFNGEFDLVSSENHSLVDFISTKINPSFFINKAAIDLYEHFILDLSKLEDQLMNKPVIITGQSLGGYLAILFTLRLHHAVDIQESIGSRKNKRPICITFGSPLLGDEALQRAISARPTWKSSLLNVVTKTDPLACIFTSETIYKPFGTFMCCTESGGHTTFEDQEAILAVLDTMAAYNAEKNEMHDYRDTLRSIGRKVLNRGAFESGKPHLNSLRAGIILQFKEVGVFDEILNDLILRMEAKHVRGIGSHMNTYESTKKLNDMKISLMHMEWYMKTMRSKGGYYDSYKNAYTSEELMAREEIAKHKKILDNYWRKFVGEKDSSPLKESAQLSRQWLFSATNYRRIVEPLEIADHYRIGYTNYIQSRQYHYNLLEKWYSGSTGSYLREKGRNRASSLTREKIRNRASSLTVDSLFWAHVEEAWIALRDLRKEGSSNNADDIIKRLEQFEAYLMNGINNFDVSLDIFLDGSSVMKWWTEYKEYKGNSYVSEFATYMNSGSYRMYQ